MFNKNPQVIYLSKPISQYRSPGLMRLLYAYKYIVDFTNKGGSRSRYTVREVDVHYIRNYFYELESKGLVFQPPEPGCPVPIMKSPDEMTYNEMAGLLKQIEVQIPPISNKLILCKLVEKAEQDGLVIRKIT